MTVKYFKTFETALAFAQSRPSSHASIIRAQGSLRKPTSYLDDEGWATISPSFAQTGLHKRPKYVKLLLKRMKRSFISIDEFEVESKAI